MAKLTFKFENTENNREASNIEFTVPDDPTIGEFKILCVRLAHAMGYSEKTIRKEFGNLVFGNEVPHTIKTLLNEIQNEG